MTILKFDIHQFANKKYISVFTYHRDAIASFVLVFILTSASYIFAPTTTVSFDRLNDFWEDLWRSDPAYIELSEDDYPNDPEIKEIALDLPFVQDPNYLAIDTESEDDTSPATVAWSDYTIQRNDTLGGILNKLNVDRETRNYLVTQKMISYRKLRRGRNISYQQNDAGQLLALRYKASPELHLNFVRTQDGQLQVSEGAPTLTRRRTVSAASITSETNSLFAASDRANVPDAIIQKIIDSLESRIDFVRDTRLGDNFIAVYETLYDEEGEYAGPGELFGVNYVNKGNTIIGMLNTEDGFYYTPTGESLQQAFLRSPLKFSRISSRYTNSRFHPVLKKWRAHRGVDFAAPTNTPVRSTAAGTVSFVGKSGGYGNLIRVEHYGRYSTLYAHLNKYAADIKKGTKVEQGQLIGYVGSTGLATGPHLHYEFRVNDKHIDPLSVEVPTKLPSLENENLTKFLEETQSIATALGI